MANKTERSENFRLDNMRLTFPYLFEARKKEKGEPKFEATLLWPKGVDLIGAKTDGSQLNVLQEAGRLAVAHWGEKAKEWIASELIKNPRLDGDGKQGINKKTGERYAGYAGHWFIRTTANIKYPPQMIDDVFGSDGKPVVVTDPKRFYPGCYVHAVLNLFTWENNEGGKGLTFGLQLLQFAKDGDRLGGGGGPRAEEFFKGVTPPAGGAGKTEGKPAGDAGGLFS